MKLYSTLSCCRSVVLSAAHDTLVNTSLFLYLVSIDSTMGWSYTSAQFFIMAVSLSWVSRHTVDMPWNCFDFHLERIYCRPSPISVCAGEALSSTLPDGTPFGAGRLPRHHLLAAAPTAPRPWLSAILWSPAERAVASHCCLRRPLTAPCQHTDTHTLC